MYVDYWYAKTVLPMDSINVVDSEDCYAHQTAQGSLEAVGSSVPLPEFTGRLSIAFSLMS